MSLSVVEMAEVRELVGYMLEELGLEAYIFDVEPDEPLWELRVECALSEGWQTTTLRVDPQRLRSCREDNVLRQQLLAQWHGHLAPCKR